MNSVIPITLHRQRYRLEDPAIRTFLAVSHYLMEMLSFSRLKIRRSGLIDAADSQVLIHKERELDGIVARYPADCYVLVDGKVRILSPVKHAWNSQVTGFSPPGQLRAGPKGAG